jgi:hypothetical protein
MSVSVAYAFWRMIMTILKGLTIVAVLVAGGTSLAMAQNGLPTGGERPVAGGGNGSPLAPGFDQAPGAPGYAAPAYIAQPGYAVAPAYVGQPGYVEESGYAAPAYIAQPQYAQPGYVEESGNAAPSRAATMHQRRQPVAQRYVEESGNAPAPSRTATTPHQRSMYMYAPARGRSTHTHIKGL